LIEELNDTYAPWQNGFEEANMVILPGKRVLTVMLIGSEVTGFPLAHCRLDVRIQATTFPFCGVKLVGLFVPL